MQLTKAPFLTKLHETAPNCGNFGITWHQSSEMFPMHKFRDPERQLDGSHEAAGIATIIFFQLRP